MSNTYVASYTVQKLNFITENSWAVIAQPNGSIAITPSGQLLMQLYKEDAQRIAASLNAEASIMSAREPLTMWPETEYAC